MPDLEHRGEKYSIRWDARQRILMTEFWGAHTKADAGDYRDQFIRISEQISEPGALSILADTTRQESSDSEAKEIYTEVSKHPRSGNSAVVCTSVAIRLVATTISLLTWRHNIKIVANREEGMAWLKHKRDS